MKTTIRTVCGGSARLLVLSLVFAACRDGEEPLAPGLEDGPATEVAAPAAAALTFSQPQLWNNFFCRKGEVCLVADVTGDGKADAVSFAHGAYSSNAVFVAKSSGNGFGPMQMWENYFCLSTQTCVLGDVNGDRKADAIAFTRGTSPRVFVALSNGSGFGAPQQWSSFFCRNGEVCKVADVNGDTWADLVAFRHRLLGNRNGVYVALSNSSGFGASQEWTTRFCHSTETCEVGDFNANGIADILAFTRDANNDAFVGLSTQLAFAPPAQWSSFFCRTGEVCLVADVTADRKADVIAFNHGLDGANAVYVGLSTGTGFGAPTKAHDFFCTKSQTCAVGDVTGDRKADVIAFTRGANPRVFVGVSQ
jgi:hypothetical protein